MSPRLGVIGVAEHASEAITAYSRAALDRPLQCSAELWIAVAEDDAMIVGAFQRASGLPDGCALHRRGSGGPEVLVGAGTVYVALALAHPGALVPCNEKRIVNRSVRPLLRALTKVLGQRGAAHFFGRDWVSVGKRPAVWVGFGHDSTTRRTLFEAFIAVRVPFARTQRPSFLGRPHGTLESIAERAVEPADIATAVAEAYASGTDPIPIEAPSVPVAIDDVRLDPPWAATFEEVIGTLGAGPDRRGRFRVGGDLLVSRDALARLETFVGEANDDDLGRLVNETLAAPGVALDGVKSLESVREVIARARHTRLD